MVAELGGFRVCPFDETLNAVLTPLNWPGFPFYGKRSQTLPTTFSALDPSNFLWERFGKLAGVVERISALLSKFRDGVSGNDVLHARTRAFLWFLISVLLFVKLRSCVY